MRPAEKWCAERLKQYLESQNLRVHIEDGPNPPDIILHVGHVEQWAVEHTTLHQYADHGGTELPRHGVDAAAGKLVERLKTATARTRRSGWHLVLDGPLDKADAKAIERSARVAIDNGDPASFGGIDPRKARLERISDPNFGIHMISMLRPTSRVPGSERLTADIQAQVNYALERTLREKGPVLRAESAYSHRVLLLQSEYPLATANNVARGLRELSELTTGIDLIFLISADASISLVWGSLPSEA